MAGRGRDKSQSQKDRQRMKDEWRMEEEQEEKESREDAGRDIRALAKTAWAAVGRAPTHQRA